MKPFRPRIGYLFIALLAANLAISQDQHAIDRKSFYEAMRSRILSVVNRELNKIREAPDKEREPFEGALTMKKAGMTGSPAKKLKMFKSGHSELESAIKKEPANAEFRFLRLMIQENSPGILGYKHSMKEDINYIKNHFETLPQDIRDAIKDYEQKSKYLKIDNT